MPTLFPSYDGGPLAYHLIGKGPILVCIPGGPARASSYMDTLGGLDEHFTLAMLDNRGSGDSGDASDVDSYGVRRLAQDVEELRKHLGLETIDLLGHSGGAQIGVYYAAAYPNRLNSLSLIAGGHRLVGVEHENGFMDACGKRASEPWYPAAREALDTWFAADGPVPDELKQRAAMFFYGPWTEQAKAHAAADAAQRRNPEAGANFHHEHDVEALAKALRELAVPKLIYTGELDPVQSAPEGREFAAMLANVTHVEQPGAGHFPWVDDPAYFSRAVASFLNATCH